MLPDEVMVENAFGPFDPFEGTPALREAGMLRRLSRRRLRGEGLPAGIYAPGDTVIVDARQAIGAGEVVLAEIAGRDALYRHAPGAAIVRFEPGDAGALIHVPVSDLRVVGVVIGLRRDGTVPRRDDC